MAGVGGKRPGAGRKPGKVGEAKRALSEMAKEHAEAALRTLADIAVQGDTEGARVSAAIAILDRAFGKPPQSLEHSGPNGGPIEHRESLTDKEVARRLAFLLVKGAREGGE